MDAKKAVYSPTANIAGLSAGYEGPGSKTVIPATAMAKMDFRLVPDQDPEDIVQKLRRHLRDGGFDEVEVEYLGGEKAAQTPVGDPFVQLTARVAEEVYGVPPRISPLVGGSGPMHPFREYLDVPIVTVGVGYPLSLVHAPNENITVENFVLGTRHMAHLVKRFAEE
jgi:acetylornithine deacetylase/succinyl-diaminopimelate desuccinylase-like protein